MKGKYNSEKDQKLHELILDGWSNEASDFELTSSGDVLILTEEDEKPDLIGNYFITEDRDGFVSVEEFESEREAYDALTEWERERSDSA